MSEILYAECRQCGSVNRFDNEKGKRPVCGKCSTQLDPRGATSDRPLSVTDGTFADEVLGAKVPVLVDFFATWCGACRSVEPSLEAVASRYKGRLKVSKLDVESSPDSARTYQITATPTLIVFRDGRPAEQAVGALPERELRELVERHIG